MKKQKGFDVIEVIVGFGAICVVIVIGLTILLRLAEWNKPAPEKTLCIAGYVHQGERGDARQVLNEEGKGIKCDN